MYWQILAGMSELLCCVPCNHQYKYLSFPSLPMVIKDQKIGPLRGMGGLPGRLFCLHLASSAPLSGKRMKSGAKQLSKTHWIRARGPAQIRSPLSLRNGSTGWEDIDKGAKRNDTVLDYHHDHNDHSTNVSSSRRRKFPEPPRSSIHEKQGIVGRAL